MVKATEAARWGEYIEHAQKFATDELEESELNYKRRTGKQLREVRDAVLSGGDDWLDRLKRIPTKRMNNLCNWRSRLNLFKWFDTDPGDALEALRKLWARDNRSPEQAPPVDEVVARIRDFAEWLPEDVFGGVGGRVRPISVLLMALDAEQYPPFMVTKFKAAYKRIGYRMHSKDADEAEIYKHALGFLDRFIQEAEKRELDRPSNRLEAQSLVFCLSLDRPLGPRGTGTDEVEEANDSQQPPDVEMLAGKLLFDVNSLRDIERLLDDKRQVIFQGPPGTGKTYVARELAACFAGSKKRVTLVQFHPSYAYEDFVQGFRPILKSRQPGFDLRSGPLLEAAERARKEPASKHFLVIDEINRGNVAKVFGELYFLLEYRNEEMRLQYSDSDERFALPDNLYIIGTMNTADRSIALVDLALRRRFHFVEFHPDKPPVKGLLKRWLKKNADEMEWVADVVDSANEKLGDRQVAIGPSYFMKQDSLDESTVRLIWEHSVLPYIEEHLYGEHGRLGEFALAKLRHRVEKKAGEQDDTSPNDASD